MSSRLERFTAKTEPATKSDCILWTGAKLPKGYGRFAGTLAHRWIYAHTHGVNLDRMDFILHSCDTPSCVNVDHLRIGTAKENTADMDERGRRVALGAVGERNRTAKLTADQVVVIRTRYAAGGTTYAALGREYGLTDVGIRQVVSRKNWAHVA